MNGIVVGVIGHVDHGKTALVRALTGIETDRLAEEKRRGLSIELGFAHFAAGDDRRVDLIDMPGHERFVRTMIAGATGIDAVLLVVAAPAGIQAQTLEHVEIARLLGLRHAVGAISMADLAASVDIPRLADDFAELLDRNGIAAEAPVVTSATDGRGMPELKGALARLPARPQTRGGAAFLPVDRAFVVPGHGPVVTGTLRGAPLQAGDQMSLLPTNRKVRIRSVQVHGETVVRGEPGQRVAVNLRDAAIADLARGMAVADRESLAPADWLTLAISPARGAPPLRNGQQVIVLAGTGESVARLRLLDRDVLRHDDEPAFCQLRCADPIVLPAGEHVVLRLPSPVGTVAGGRLIDPLSRRLKRHEPVILQRLRELRDLPAEGIVAAEAERSGTGAAVTVAGLARLLALTPARIEALLGTLPVVVTAGGTVLREVDVAQIAGRIPPLLADQPLGLSRKQLASALAGSRAPLVDAALARLLGERRIAWRGSQLVVPRPEEDRTAEQSEAALAASMAATIRAAGLSPPSPGALAGDPRSRRALDRLLRAGTLVRCVDRAKGREMVFHGQAVASAQERLAPLLDQGDGLLVGEIAAVLGISRKFAMPLLAHLDATRFTRRIGDRRIRHRSQPREGGQEG